MHQETRSRRSESPCTPADYAYRRVARALRDRARQNSQVCARATRVTRRAARPEHLFEAPSKRRATRALWGRASAARERPSLGTTPFSSPVGLTEPVHLPLSPCTHCSGSASRQARNVRNSPCNQDQRKVLGGGAQQRTWPDPPPSSSILQLGGLDPPPPAREYCSRGGRTPPPRSSILQLGGLDPPPARE